MDVHLDGYRFVRQLRGSSVSQVWAAERSVDGQAVVAKLFAIEDRADLEARVRHEFELIRRLDVAGVVRALALEHSGRNLILVLEAHTGVDLAEHLGGRAMAIGGFFELAVQLVRILAEVHEQRVIHRDIKPSNILITPSTGVVKLADFGISVLLESERGRIHEREVVEGTLPYMAPEQTGRTSRAVDFRSDLYALGVTFYEVLTGRRPFDASSPLELIHAQLAQRPRPPQQLRPELPTALSRLVLKLLEKAPERRYQSAQGLLTDLLALRDNPDAELELGRGDLATSLQLPHQLYGRERELGRLRAAFVAVGKGTPGLVAITGPAGVGKTALLDVLVEPVLERRGFIARGKFDLDVEQPFSGIVAALSSLADQLLTESSHALARWREQLRESLAGFAPVIVELVPRFRAVLGEQEASRELAPAETRNHVMLACGRLLACFARPEHPLVLALDDLQWADAGSLELLVTVFAESDAAILVVATAREQALAPDAGLRELITRVAVLGRSTIELELGPLEQAPLRQLLGDALSCAPERVATLAEIVARKTASNPFFVRQFLLDLAERDLLLRTPDGWTWDPVALDAAALPEDALDMMSQKLQRLDDPLRELIGVASVFGSEFDPLAVERVSGGTWVGRKLHELVDEGLISPLAGRGYAFGHDRIREAAYGLLDEARRRALHRAVADDLLARLAIDERTRRVFEIVEHLDRGYDLDADAAIDRVPASRRVELAELNVLAGQRALRSGAPASARTWLLIAERLLIETDDRSLLSAAQLALAQAEALTGAFARADERLQALQRAEPALAERGRLAKQRLRVLVLGDDMESAVVMTLAALRELGVEIPERPSKLALLAAVIRMSRLARPAAIERWRSSEPMHDPVALVACDLLVDITNAAYVVRPELFVLFTARFVELIYRHGDHPNAAQSFAQVGLVLANAFGRRREGWELTERCLAIARARGPNPVLFRAENTLVFAKLWFEPLHSLVPPLRTAMEAALEVGDMQMAAYANTMHDELGLFAGVHLRVLARQIEARLIWTTRWGTASLAGAIELLQEVVHALIEGPVPATDELDPHGVGRYGDAGFAELRHVDAKVISGLALAVFGQHDKVARLYAGLFDALERVMPGGWCQLPVLAFEGVAAAVGCRGAAASEQRRLRSIVRRNAKTLQRWTRAGGNFGHGHALLEAELAALAGELQPAIEHYRRACRLAAEQRNLWFEAVAWERLATLLHEHDEQLAFGPLRQARDRYLRWGAFAKVAALEQQWPSLARATSLDDASGSTTTPTSSSTTSHALDTASLIKTSAAIADDLRLEQVVERIMAIAIENAGAQRGVLLLAEAGELRIVAEAQADHDARNLLAQPRRLEDATDVPATLLRWVERTRETVLLANASADPRFAGDPYLRTLASGSLMCLPIIKQQRLGGLLYLENKLSSGAFTLERLELLRLLTSQAASALDNARLYTDLRTSEIRWRSLVEQLPDVVVLVSRQHNVEFANVEVPTRGDGALGMLGPEHREPLLAAFGRVFAGDGQQQLEVEAQSRTGSLAWFSVRLAPIVVDGRIDRAILVATDISERKHAEAERARFEQQQRQQQRLEAIGTLASGVAHEINNPVQGIMNYAELIAGSGAADDEIREFAGEIEHETQRVSAIVRNLLAFSRQEQVSFESGSVVAIVEGTLSLIRAVLRKDQIKLELAVPPNLPLLRCRPQQIQQVVMNLITNARDAVNARHRIAADKRISIDAGTFERDGAAWVVLRVTDSGGGVPAHAVAKIFEPFFTTKGRDAGTGLGLSVSHGIVADHGGVLRLDNRPGEGATFAIELPVAGPPTPSLSGSDGRRSAAS